MDTIRQVQFTRDSEWLYKPIRLEQVRHPLATMQTGFYVVDHVPLYIDKPFSRVLQNRHSFFFLVKNLPMPYRHWHQRADMASCLRWYRVEDIIVHVHLLRGWIMNADVQQQTPPGLNPSPPVCRLRRFPEDAHVCEAIGGWGLRLDRLALSLLLLHEPARLERAYPHTTTPGEAEIAVLDMIDDILRAVETYEDVFTRESFENRYDLQWHADSAPEPSEKPIKTCNNITGNQ